MSERPRLAKALYDLIPEKGIFEQDLMNLFLLRHSRVEVEKALAWMGERRLIRKCGSPVRPLYVRPENGRVRYTNIRPVHGTAVLLTMHRNFEESK